MEWVIGYLFIGVVMAVASGLANGDLFDDLAWRLIIIFAWPFLIAMMFAVGRYK